MRFPEGLELPKDAPPEGACVRIERPETGLAVIVLDPPHRKLPVFDLALMRDFDLALATIEREIGVTGVVIAGRDPLTFVAGADIDVIEEVEEVELARELARIGQALFARVAALPMRTVAAVGGAVPGGACELALACGTIVVADHPSTRIGLPEVRLGILPGWGGTQRLPRRIGVPRALEAILTGRLYSARDAQRIGLVDRVTPPEYLHAVAADIALGRSQPRRRSRGLAKYLVDLDPLAAAVIARKALAGVMAETRGRYPAPLAALKLTVAAPRTTLARGLEREAEALGELAVTDVCKNLISIFRLTEEAKRLGRLPDGSEARTLSSAGVVGAGVMGAGIAALLAQKGVETRLSDVARAPLDAAVLAHRREIRRQLERRRMPAHEADAAVDRLEIATDLTGFARKELVIEAVAEKLEIKRKVLGTLAAEMADDAILATNTSSLSVADIARDLPNAERVVGMHFFNPVALMPLVEVVRGPRTADWAVAAIAKLALRIGKTPVVVRDVAGFLVNRVLGPYLDESVRLFELGIETERIDAAAVEFGLPMGPLELLDEVGLDIAAHASASLHEAYGERMSASPLVARALEGGLKGKKGGAGFYLYAPDPRTGRPKKTGPNPAIRALASPPARAGEISDYAITDHLVLALANEGVRALEDGVTAGPRELDLATVFGMGFPPFRGGLLRWCDSLGAAEICARMARVCGSHEVLARREGPERFRPAALLVELAKSGGRLHSQGD